MEAQLQNLEPCCVAETVAPEDLRAGDFVAVLAEIVEIPSFFWRDSLVSAHSDVVRVRHLPTENRAPLKIKAICLPFVFVKSPDKQYQTIDVRLASLVRLETSYAKTVWKKLKPNRPAATPAATSC